MRRSVPRLALALVIAGTIGALSGCHGCRSDHPFVPYRIEAGKSSAEPAPDASASIPEAGAAGAFVREAAALAPPHSATWTLEGVVLTAPPGTLFRQGLAWDLDGDGHVDALALVEEVDEAVHEQLVFYRGVAEGSPSPERVPLVRSGAAPESLAIDPRCARIEHLTRVGKRSAAVELGEACVKEDASTPGPDRTVALVAWSDSLRTRVAFTVVDPPDAHALAFELDGSDVDGDGLDDVTLKVSLEGGGAPFEPAHSVHATFRWFDRPAGMSREPGEPERSFHGIAALAAQRAIKPKEAAAAVATAAAGRFLFQAVCGESPGRRVATGASETVIPCDAGHALEELGLAETRAYATLGDPIRAIAALDAAGLPPATRTAARVVEATGWVTALAPVVQATAVRAIGAVPLLGHDHASWGALRFEPSGTLLVRTPSGVVRVDPVHGDEADATGVSQWPSKVVSPDGKVILDGAFVPCRGVALEASLTTGDGGTPRSIALPIASPVGARCVSGERDAALALPIAWGPGGLEVVVSGEPVLIAPDGSKASTLFQALGQPVTPGAPRSPDGSVLVLPTSQGIAVRAQKTRLLRAKELEHGYGELRDCAVSDDASRVACVRGGVAFVGMWPLP
jgi:hypothetical protein